MNVLSVYMGTSCNFNCTYCDRDYLKSSNLIKTLQTEDVPQVVKYLEEHRPAKMISFHGGEPLMFSENISKIINLLNNKNDTYFIQTNGSLILDREEFLEEHKDQLFISISYDFSTQAKNRTAFDIEKTLKLLQEKNIPVQLQSVIDMKSDFFDTQNVLEMIRICKVYDVQQLDFITLRHIRGKTSFKVVLDEMKITEIQDYFVKMLNALITIKQFNIKVYIDGAVKSLDEHKKYETKESAVLNILSPNGKVYSEYDFLDYDEDSFVVDAWKDVPVPNKEFKLKDKCETCPQKSVCGLKFLVSMFDKEAPINCEFFYNNMVLIHTFNSYLNENNLLDIVGRDFENTFTP